MNRLQGKTAIVTGIGAGIAMSPRLSPPGDALMCFIRDNTGNLIEIIQILEPGESD